MSEETASSTPTSPRDSVWRNRTFRRFFAGQFVTNAGDSLYSVAILWLVFDLSGSTALTGLANAMLLSPFLLQIVAGPVVDRLPLKRVMVGAQVVQGVVVLALPLAAVTGTLSVALVLGIVPVLALVTLLMAPVQTTLLPRIVAEENLSEGNAAMATVSLGLDMLFDAAGGVVIALFGTTALFLLDSATFAVAAALFASMAVPRVTPEESPGPGSVLDSYVADLRAGIAILRGSAFVPLLAATAVTNFAVGVTLAILPAYGDFLGGPALYGFLLGALGVGRLVGSLVGPRLEGRRYGRLLIGGGIVSGAVWLAAVVAPGRIATVALFAGAWIWPGANGVLTATLNQRVFPDDVLGRISATKGTAATATLPLGSVLGGVLAGQLGVPTSVALAALGFLGPAVALALVPAVRGLPSVATATPSDYDLSLAED